MVFEVPILIGIEFNSFAPDTEIAFCPTAVLRESICTSEPFLVILCYTLFRRSKLIFSTFESAETYRFLYIKDASFSRKILLKLIHFESRNIGVTWSRFKYFPLLATFAAKLIHYSTSYCSFTLHSNIIEHDCIQGIYRDKSNGIEHEYTNHQQ